MGLAERLEELGQALGEREASHGEAMQIAWARARELHESIGQALNGFASAAAKAGSDHLTATLGTPHLDDKHVRAVEFDVSRGRTRAIITVKSRGEVTLVGPFRAGKTEGPCRSFPIDADPEIESALEDFLAGFLEEAFAP